MKGDRMVDLPSLWPVIAAGFGSIVWLVRLEAKGLSNEREIRRLWTQRREDLQTAKDSRDATNKMLDEIRTDVKALLKGYGR